MRNPSVSDSEEAVFCRSSRFSGWKRLNWNWYFWGLFLLLVAFGITGSSLGVLKWFPGSGDCVRLVGEKKLLGSYRPIRSDEFIAHGTPCAIAQYEHGPRFPLVNTNVGLAGSNFLVLHDSGAPVRHVSTLFRPATWGFFFLDLRRALSWYWFFPIFLAVWAIRYFLDALWPGQSKVNWLLSAAAVFAPASAAWSFWPPANVFGTCIAAGALLRLLQTRLTGRSLGYGFLIGAGLLCSALSLYVPRIWAGALLIALMTLGAVVQRKQWGELRRWSVWLAAAVAGILITLVLFSWWSDAREAICEINGSVYPGRRRLCGGTIPWWELVKGWAAPFSLFTGLGIYNQSEIQGALILIFPFSIYIILFFRKLRGDAVFWGILMFQVLALWYQHIGFPPWLAAVTFFDRCNPCRFAYALVLSQMFLLGLFYHHRLEASRAWWKDAAFTVLSLIPVVLLFAAAPAELWKGMWILIVAIATAAVYCLIVFLFFRRVLWGLLAYCVFNSVLGLMFNPVCVAPRRVESPLAALIASPSGLRNGGRMLFVDQAMAVMHCMAGGKAFNGYFEYQDPEIFKLLYQGQEDREQFRRLNHLMVAFTPPESPLFEASVPSPNVILLRFNAEKYDFSRLPVDFVVGYRSQEPYFSGNPSLRPVKTGEHIQVYRVVHP